MLGVGIDWAEEFHDVALRRPADGVFDEIHVDHTPAALDALVARIAALEPDPAKVRVVIETRHGLLVERLVDAGSRCCRSNPTSSPGAAARPGQQERRRRRRAHRVSAGAGPASPTCASWCSTAKKRGNCALARGDVSAQRDARRLLNRLRADLLATFPGATTIAGDDLGCPGWPPRSCLWWLLLAHRRRAP